MKVPDFTNPHFTVSLPTVLLLSLTSCTLGPDFRLPILPGSNRWKEQSPQKSPVADMPDTWWKLFGDRALDQTIDTALASNSDLAAAAARVRTARALTGLDRARWFPVLGLTGNSGISRASEDSTYDRMPRMFNIDLESVRHRAQFELSYDPDLWGANRRRREASSSDADAAMFQLDAGRLGLATEVARNYFLLRGLDAQKQVLQETILSRQQAFDIQQSKSESGLSDGLAATRARTELELARNDLEAVERQRGSAEHALAVLCGKRPVDFTLPPAPAASSPPLPGIRAGLPADVLLRRPDIRAAAAQLRAANARIGVAEAAFYPDFTLSGSAGFESVEARRFLDLENRILSLGAGVMAPVFDGGANRANFDASVAKRDEALANYRTALLTALREVEDAMLDLKSLANSRRSIEAAFASAAETRKLALERYEKGLSPYLEVVEADRTLLQARLLLARVDSEQRIILAVLAKAVGGGWGASASP